VNVPAKSSAIAGLFLWAMSRQLIEVMVFLFLVR
jgi:hypothetical protein